MYTTIIADIYISYDSFLKLLSVELRPMLRSLVTFLKIFDITLPVRLEL